MNIYIYMIYNTWLVLESFWSFLSETAEPIADLGCPIHQTKVCNESTMGCLTMFHLYGGDLSINRKDEEEPKLRGIKWFHSMI